MRAFLRFATLAPLVLGSSMLFASSKKVESGGWIYVRLEGSPRQIGLQHGKLLAAQIDDAVRMEKVYLKLLYLHDMLSHPWVTWSAQ